MESCIFCKIIAGEIPSSTLYEDEDFKVILDISPAAKGHAILLPKKHFANLYEMDEETAEKALKIAGKVAKAMKEELLFDGLNVLQNNGEAAGQTVFHYHIHLIPRFHDDRVKMTWAEGKYEEGEAVKLAKSIAERICNDSMK